MHRPNELQIDFNPSTAQLSLNLPVPGMRTSVVSLSVAADDVQFVVNNSPANITRAQVRACLPTEFGCMLCKSALDWPGCSCLDGSAPRQPCTAVRLILASRPPVPGLLIFLVALLTAGVHVWRQDLRRL